MDDTELGRPARHQRPESESQLRRQDPAARGAGAALSIDERQTCGRCGAEYRVQVTAPADSLAARAARAWLDARLCERCGDQIAAEHDAEDRVRQDLARLRGRLERAEIPTDWQISLTDSRLDRDGDRADAFAVCDRWAAGDLLGGLLHGGVGRGKTLLSAAAATQRTRLGEVRWMSVSQLMFDLTSDFGAERRERALRLLDGRRGRAARVLDDLDKVKPTDHQLQVLYQAVNACVERRLPLLVTLNTDPERLAAALGGQWGEAIASRLLGYCEVAHVGGHDRRLA